MFSLGVIKNYLLEQAKIDNFPRLVEKFIGRCYQIQILVVLIGGNGGSPFLLELQNFYL